MLPYKQLAIIFIILFQHTYSFAKDNITTVSNLVEPVGFFVNHQDALSEITSKLHLFNKVSIVGLSGIGKTQIVRMYTKKHIKSYDIIWFFDCTKDLNEQFTRLASFLNKTFATTLNEDTNYSKDSVLDYLANKNNWLIVFDNLKINENNKVKDILNWEHNGHIIICSQDAKDLNNIIYLNCLDEQHAEQLLQHILGNSRPQLMLDLIKIYNGHPLMLTQVATFLSDNNNITLEEYKKITIKSNDKIKTHLSTVVNNLSSSSLDLLNKIVLLNNQYLTKDLLYFVSSYKESFAEDIYNLTRLGLISTIKSGVFEMHDIVKNSILSLSSEPITRDNIVQILDKTTNLFKAGGTVELVERSNIKDDLEQLLTNAEQYKVDIYKVMEIRKVLLNFYLFNLDYYNCKKMISWLEEQEKQGSIKLEEMNNDAKAIYAEYCSDIGEYLDFGISDVDGALGRFKKAAFIIDQVNDYEQLKFNIYAELSQTQIYSGDILNSKINLSKAETILNHNNDLDNSALYFFIKAKILLTEGNYQDSLNIITTNMSKLSHLPQNSTHVAPYYMFQAEALNYLSKYNQAYEIINKVYKQQKEIIKDEHEIHARILIQLAKSELGLKKIHDAEIHILHAKDFYINDPLRTNKDIQNSIDIDLADALIVLGDVYNEKQNYQQAIVNYQLAEKIFNNCYKDNFQSDQISILLFKLANLGLKTHNIALFREYYSSHENLFGFNHHRTKKLLDNSLDS